MGLLYQKFAIQLVHAMVEEASGRHCLNEPAAARSPITKITVVMDPDTLLWTHFYGPIGSIRALQDFPPALQDQFKPPLRILKSKGAKRLFFVFGTQRVELDGTDVSLADVFEDTADDVASLLRLTAWWIEHGRRRAVCRRTHTGKRLHKHWRCMDCNELNKAERMFCHVVECPSREKIQRITGKAVLEVIAESA